MRATWPAFSVKARALFVVKSLAAVGRKDAANLVKIGSECENGPNGPECDDGQNWHEVAKMVQIGTEWRKSHSGLVLPNFALWPNLILGGLLPRPLKSHPRHNVMQKARTHDLKIVNTIFTVILQNTYGCRSSKT